MSKDRVVGTAALLIAMAAWAGFALSTRAIGASHLSTPQVCAIRYLTPALVLAPWWSRAGREARRAGPRACLGVAVGGGAPFFLLTALGANLSSASHISIVNLGATPIVVALFTRTLRPGLLIIAAGIGVLALGTPGGGVGVLVLLLSAVLWSVYTMAQGPFSPLTVVLLMCVPSAVLTAPALLRITAPATEIVAFTVVQGLGSGIVSAVSYNIALRHLGVPATTLASAFTPVLVALMSAVLFDETLTLLAGLGLTLVSAGVLRQGLRRAPASPA